MTTENANSTQEASSLHSLGRCVACGVETNGTYGKREEQDALPCCFECYSGTKLREWLDKHEGNAPTDPKLSDVGQMTMENTRDAIPPFAGAHGWAALTWSEEKPRACGWWWWRGWSGDRPKAVEVQMRSSPWMYGGYPPELNAWDDERKSWEVLWRWRGAWAGPIDPRQCPPVNTPPNAPVSNDDEPAAHTKQIHKP